MNVCMYVLCILMHIPMMLLIFGEMMGLALFSVPLVAN